MILFCVTLYSHAKDYALPKFQEMLRSCVLPHEDTRVVIYGDNPDLMWALSDHPRVMFTEMPHPGGRYYAEDMLMAARETARRDALAMKADKMVWAGVDWYFNDSGTAEYERLIGHNVPVVAPLITARTDANRLVCRTFQFDDEGSQIVERQEDTVIEDHGDLQLVQGFPGADSIVIDKALFNISLTEGHTPWYTRVEQGQEPLCCEENWALQAVRQGYSVYADTGIRVWHAHEDGTARRWKGVEASLRNLHWT